MAAIAGGYRSYVFCSRISWTVDGVSVSIVSNDILRDIALMFCHLLPVLRKRRRAWLNDHYMYDLFGTSGGDGEMTTIRHDCGRAPFACLKTSCVNYWYVPCCSLYPRCLTFTIWRRWCCGDG
jgi:hypothetical protein